MKDLVEFIKGFDLHMIITVGVAFLWMNSNINNRMDSFDKRLTLIEREISIIKTVLITKGIMPETYAHKGIDERTSKD